MIQNILCFLERSAQQYPEKAAFRDRETEYSYCRLLAESRRIGGILSRKTGPRRPIPVLAEKSAAVIAVFMGIVTAGCFYVLIDPAQPEARLKKILDTLEPELLVVDPGCLKYKLIFTGEVIELDTLTGRSWDLAEEDRILQMGADEAYLSGMESDEKHLSWLRNQAVDTDPLYGIFTSGSTGDPKGVVVSHRSVIDFILHFTRLFHITEVDVIGNQAPFDFDVSVKDIYSGLCVGATVELIPKRLFSIPTELLDYLCDRKITTTIWAVSALCMISALGGFAYRIPEFLNKVLFSGEVMPVKHLNIWKTSLPAAMFVNLYGPTEITCNCTYYILDREFSPGETIPIGIPFPNEKVFLLDEEDKLVKERFQTGEICVSGTALALGYYRSQEKTAENFVQNPLNHSYPELIYCTGDLAHYDEDGLLCYESRKDFQIKHMGHRIELGEIEHALEAVEGVERAVCIYIEEKNKIAVFYEGIGDRRSIALQLSEYLPPYMVPNIYRKVEVFPVTKNGKVDRRKLQESL